MWNNHVKFYLFFVNFFITIYRDLRHVFFQWYSSIPDIDQTIYSFRWNDIEIRSRFYPLSCYYFRTKSLRKLPLFRTTIDKREIMSYFIDNILLVEETWPTIAISFWNILNGSLRIDSPTGSEQRSRKR